jgi:hypothetical protein
LAVGLRHGLYERFHAAPEISVACVRRSGQEPGLREIKPPNPGLPFRRFALPRSRLNVTLEGGPGRIAVGTTKHFPHRAPARLLTIPDLPQGCPLSLSGDAARSPGCRLGLDTAVTQRLGERLPPEFQVGLLGVQSLASVAT